MANYPLDVLDRPDFLASTKEELLAESMGDVDWVVVLGKARHELAHRHFVQGAWTKLEQHVNELPPASVQDPDMLEDIRARTDRTIVFYLVNDYHVNWRHKGGDRTKAPHFLCPEYGGPNARAAWTDFFLPNGLWAEHNRPWKEEAPRPQAPPPPPTDMPSPPPDPERGTKLKRRHA